MNDESQDSLPGATRPAASWVILTQGDRPEQLERAVGSALMQAGVDCEILVVGNGAAPPALDPAVRTLVLEQNVGIPEGRNIGIANTAAPFVFFLDDDGYYEDDSVAQRALQRFAASEDLGVLSMRIEDPGGRQTARRHVPRLRVGDSRVSSTVTTFLGGACVIRRAVLDAVGVFPGDFFYAHEELDLAWRAIDAGFRVEYAGDLALLHPADPPSRHAQYHYLSARNRAWIAKRRLPWLLAPVYVAVWLIISLLRSRSMRAVRSTLRGFRDGLVQTAGERSPMRWSTVLRMTRWGRPPII